MSLLNKNVCFILVFVAPASYSQQDVNLASDEEDILSEEIIFDDDLFGNVFDEPPTHESDSWLDGDLPRSECCQSSLELGLSGASLGSEPSR